MITNGFTYFAFLVFLAAILLNAPKLLKGNFWNKFFNFAPPLVLLYLGAMLLCTADVWNLETTAVTYSALKNNILYAMIFLMLLRCDIRKIIKLGPRMLLGFFAATISIGIGFVVSYALFHEVLGSGAWKSLAALCGSWMGGGGNMLAIQAALDVSEGRMGYALVMDSICASLWIMFLLWATNISHKFNAWTKSDTHLIDEVGAKLEEDAKLHHNPITFQSIMILLGGSLLVSAFSQNIGLFIEGYLPFFDKATWTVLVVTVIGLVLAVTHVGRIGGIAEISNVLLYTVIALIASRANLAELADAPIWILVGILILVIHAVIMIVLAKVFHLDIFTCSIASLANIGGTASAPVLASAYSGALIPVGVIMALLGYVVGTGGGLVVGHLMSLFG